MIERFTLDDWLVDDEIFREMVYRQWARNRDARGQYFEGCIAQVLLENNVFYRALIDTSETIRRASFSGALRQLAKIVNLPGGKLSTWEPYQHPETETPEMEVNLKILGAPEEQPWFQQNRRVSLVVEASNKQAAPEYVMIPLALRLGKFRKGEEIYEPVNFLHPKFGSRYL